MEVRITFRSEVYIKGETLEEIKEKWEDMPIFCVDALMNHYANFVELESVEDADTCEDLMIDFV